VRAPEADPEQFGRVWEKHVYALNGQYEMAD
jgi:hypothetical protein